MLLTRLCIIIYYLLTVFSTSASCYILVIYEPHSLLHLIVGIFLLNTFCFTSHFPSSQTKQSLPSSFIHITELYKVFSPNSTIAAKLSDDRTVLNLPGDCVITGPAQRRGRPRCLISSLCSFLCLMPVYLQYSQYRRETFLIKCRSWLQHFSARR